MRIHRLRIHTENLSLGAWSGRHLHLRRVSENGLVICDWLAARSLRLHTPAGGLPQPQPVLSLYSPLHPSRPLPEA